MQSDQPAFQGSTYVSPGPIASAFLASREPVRGIMGPFGSGKTNVIIFDALTCASQMPPALDGNRYFRGIILRDNYTNLWKTLIPSWFQWFPKKSGIWSGGDGRQAKHELEFDLPDGSKLYFEMWFLAIQDSNVENVLRGIEFTWGNLNEADLVSDDVLPYMLQRVLQRRYPTLRMMGEGNMNYFVGITLDFNPPDVDNWIYDIFEVKRPKGHVLFKQPSGRGERGENRRAIPKSVYIEMAETNAHKPWLVQRMVDGEFGYSRSGNPVYTDYVDSVHCADMKLKPLAGVPLRLGFDQGIQGPAMVVAQWTATKQLRVLHEFVPGRMSPSEFGRQCLTLLQTQFEETGIDPVNINRLVKSATCDPAGKQGEVAEEGHSSWLQTVAETMGLDIGVAESNEIDIRIEGVSQLLRADIDRTTPALLICPKNCSMLRKGFNSHYHYKKRTNGNVTSLDPKPEKNNKFADPHDALQYLVQDLMGLQAVISGLLTGTYGRGDNEQFDRGDDDFVQLNTDFDVHGV